MAGDLATCRGMASWTIEQDVREDAERVFVPAELLADAVVGDEVTVRPVAPSHDVRRGSVVEVSEDEVRGRFFTIAFP